MVSKSAGWGGKQVMDPMLSIIIAQLVVSLYLSWKVFSLQKQVEGVETVLGYVLVKYGITGPLD